ncbi:MAG TPA: cupin domain-containing protein [Chloroflexota bacterium]|nr:cupin domain-containing protein [Chloroflexota bacterium]
MTEGPSLEQLDDHLLTQHLTGSWMGRTLAGRAAPKPQPRTGYAANLWKWPDIHAGLLESGKLVPVGPQGLTEMRSIRGAGALDQAIDMNAQILMPGERTRAHRNMRNETRLVWQAPAGAVFVCDGQAFPMQRGDLIVSPTWTDHDHYNGGDTPAIWVDGYDTGYARLGAEINIRYPEANPYQQVRPSPPERLKPWPAAPAPRPPVHYPWPETRAALDALHSDAQPDPYDPFQILFTSPVDGGPTLPTIAWHAQLLPSGCRTKRHRHNSTTCCHAFEGHGVTTVEDERLEWDPGDLFTIPPWTWHSHHNPSSTEAVLFSIDDWPAMTALGFYRKEEG